MVRLLHSMPARVLSMLLMLAAAAGAVATSAQERGQTNPIRRVVNMLQAMQVKIQDEGKKGAKVFDEAVCNCQSQQDSLKQALGEAEAKLPQIESMIKESTAEKTQLTSEVAQHNQDREDAKSSVQEATDVRTKAAADYASESTDMANNIEQLGKAVVALEKGVGAAFLQSPAAEALRLVVQRADLGDADKETLASFLEGSENQGEGYEPQSGEVIGILKQLKETMEGDLAESTETEEKAKTDFEALAAAKARETEALGTAIEEKTTRLGEVGLELVNAKADLESTTSGQADDTKLLGDIEAACASTQKEQEEVSKLRSEELVAIADTIKILNDDSALDLFKNTLASPSLAQESAERPPIAFLQLRSASHPPPPRRSNAPRVGAAKQTSTAKSGVQAAEASPGKTSSGGFEKVVKMTDDMVVTLGKEQTNDETKQAYCKKELDTADDEKREIELATSDLEKVIDNSKASESALVEELTVLEAGIKKLDGDITENTKLRKEEHDLYIEDLQSDNAAKELLAIAKNRLMQFYNRAHTTRPPTEVAEAERISNAFEAPAFLQVGSAKGYVDKAAESQGVTQMIDLLSADLTKDMQEGAQQETRLQTDYEEILRVAAEKRDTDAKSVAEKEGQKAELESSLQKSGQELKDKQREFKGNTEYIAGLHRDCDWLLENFGVRKEARAAEVEALHRAKAILSGSDYSLVQASTPRGATRALRARPLTPAS